MKKLILAFVVLSLIAVSLSGCSSSRKGGCPMTEKIIRG